MSGDWQPPPRAGRPPPRWTSTRVAVWVVIGAIALYFIGRGLHITKFEVIFFCVLVPSIVLHEVSHGWVANLLGDDTAKRARRLSLNPLRHIDPFGSIVVPILLVLSNSGIAFGWAKPVPVNVSRLRNPRNGSVAVALAGPAMNAVLFFATALAFRYLSAHGVFLSARSTTVPTVYQVLYEASLANITIGVFNLLPIPPLDGSAVIERLVPNRHLHTYYRLRPFGLIIVVVFALFVLDRTNLGLHLLNGEYRIWQAVA